MEIKNHCFLYRENGIFGIKYLLCEKIRKGKGYYYKNKKTYYNMQVAEQYFAKRINFMIKPLNMFTNNELKTILFYIDTFKNNGLSSKELKDTTENIKKTIIEILKGEEIEK